MFLSLLLLFTLVPVIELMILLEVGEKIGALQTIGFVIFTGFAGAYLAKTQGRNIFDEFQACLKRNEIPTDPLFHGFLILVGGLLLLTPGFITDALGFSMVLPLFRHSWVVVIKQMFLKAMKSGKFNVQTFVVTEDPFSKSFYYQRHSSEAEYEKPPIKDAKVIDLEDHRKK